MLLSFAGIVWHLLLFTVASRRRLVMGVPQLGLGFGGFVLIDIKCYVSGLVSFLVGAVGAAYALLIVGETLLAGVKLVGIVVVGTLLVALAL